MTLGARSSRPEGFSWFPVSVPAGQAGSGSRQATSRIPTPIKHNRNLRRAAGPALARLKAKVRHTAPRAAVSGRKTVISASPRPTLRADGAAIAAAAADTDTPSLGGHGRRGQWEAPRCSGRPIGSGARGPAGRAAPHAVMGFHVGGGHGGERRRAGAGGMAGLI